MIQGAPLRHSFTGGYYRAIYGLIWAYGFHRVEGSFTLGPRVRSEGFSFRV